MTKLRNILGICMIAILIVAGIYYVSASAVPSPDAGQITALSARKEDLLVNQARIEDQLVALNATMAQAVQQQEARTCRRLAVLCV